MGGPRFLFVTNYPTPYNVSLFGAQPLRSDCTVIFYEVPDERRQWSADSLPENWTPVHGASVLRQVVTVLRLLPSHDKVLVGGSTRSLLPLFSLLICLLWRKPVALWLERSPRTPISRLLGLRALVHLGLRVVAVGFRAAEGYGVATGRRDRVFVFPYSYGRQAPVDGSGKTIHSPLELLIVGSEPERKNFEAALGAAELLRDSRTVTLSLVGSIPDPERWQRSQHDVVVGPLTPEDLKQRLAGTDVLLVPSWFDGWAVVVEEAMAAGVPVVVSAEVGAVGTLLVDGLGGRVVERPTSEDLCAAVLDIAGDPREYVVMSGEAARCARAFRRRYDAAGLCSILESL